MAAAPGGKTTYIGKSGAYWAKFQGSLLPVNFFNGVLNMLNIVFISIPTSHL